MSKLPNIEFPCPCEIFTGQIWEDAICLGLAQEGSATNIGRNLVLVWTVINKDGIPKKIYKYENVRFSILFNQTT